MGAIDQAALARGCQVPDSDQVVSGSCQGEDRINTFTAPAMQFAQIPDGLEPAEDLLHSFADFQADAISLMTGGSPVNNGTAFLLGNMGGGLPPATLSHKIGCVIPLVGTHDDVMTSRNIFDHVYRSITFRRTVGGCHPGINHQTVAVLYQRMAHVAKLGLLPFALFVQPGTRVGSGCMRIVDSFLICEIHGWIAAGVVIGAVIIFGSEAFNGCPRFQQGSVHREVFIADKPLLLGLITDRAEKQGNGSGIEQPIPIFGKYGMVPDAVIHGQADKPPIQKVVIELFHQQSFTADRENSCSKEARNRYSGGMEGRPVWGYRSAKVSCICSNARSTIFRIFRNGCLFGTRCSREM
jgi:hypothetical protein